MWDSVVRRVEDSIGIDRAVTNGVKLPYQLVEDPCVPASSHPWDVLHREVARPQLRNNTEKVEDELVALIVDQPLADRREPLTRRTAKNDVYRFSGLRVGASVPLQPGGDDLIQMLRMKLREVRAQHLRQREVELMNRCVDRVVLDGSDYVETSLLETKR